jgi:alpha-mannosidase
VGKRFSDSARGALLLLFALFVCRATVAGEPPKKLKEIIVVYKTHFDIGYTDLVSNVVKRYRTSMIDSALELVDQSGTLPPEQRFVWTLPGWPMSQILWPGQDPERRKRVLEAYRNRRFVTHALPFTTHTESLEAEDLVRGLGFASRLSRSVGLDLPRDAKMTDVPSHSWIIPTILKQAGVEFFHIGCNEAVASPDVPMLFWWEGPDGSRVLTMYSDSYGSQLAPPDGWPYSTWLALIHSGDNHGPPPPENIRKLLDEAREKLPGVKVRMGRLSDFSDAILAEKPQLPVIRSDMPDTWIHGIMSLPVETQQAHRTRPLLAAVEALHTLLAAWKTSGSVVPEMASAYEQSLLYGEHTWGLNMQRLGPRAYGEAWEKEVASRKFKRLEQSFADHGAYSNRLHELTSAATQGNLAALARGVSINGGRIVVFNGLPWRRGGVVETKLPGRQPRALRDVATGTVVPVEIRENRLRFQALDVPAMGYRAYAFADAAPVQDAGLRFDKGASTLENRRFKITLDPAGGRIVSIIDKRSGRELVDRVNGYGFAQYMRERFSKNEIQGYIDAYLKRRPAWAIADCGKPDLPPASESPYAASLATQMSIRFDSSPVAVSATMESAGTPAIPHGIALTVTLYGDSDFVDLNWSIHDKKATPWPEAGWLTLPLKVDSPSFRLARLGAVVEPGKDTIRGSNHELYCLNSGMAIVNPRGQGVGLCPIDSPLVSLEHPGIYKYSRDFLPTKPLVFLNLYNNQYSTNFAQWIRGSWSSRVRVWPIEKYDVIASVLGPSEEARVPLLAEEFDGSAGPLPAAQAGLELSRRGVAVTAFGRNPDGNGLVLRLWEQAGLDEPCTVRLPAAFKATAVQPCDLRGRPAGKPLKVTDHRFTVPLRRYAPVSLLLLDDCALISTVTTYR